MEHRFKPDEWFPREKRGTCFGGGPSSNSDMVDRKIAENIQRRLENDWDKTHELFQSYANALAKYMSITEAEGRANRLFNELCFTCQPGFRLQFRGSKVYVKGRWHIPDPTTQDIIYIKRFIKAANGETPETLVCNRCLSVIRKIKQVDHESRCCRNRNVPPSPN